MEVTDIYAYLRALANELGSRILESYPPLQSTTDEVPAELSTLLRSPLPAQAVAIGIHLIWREGKSFRDNGSGQFT